MGETHTVGQKAASDCAGRYHLQRVWGSFWFTKASEGGEELVAECGGGPTTYLPGGPVLLCAMFSVAGEKWGCPAWSRKGRGVSRLVTPMPPLLASVQMTQSPGSQG